MEEFRFDGGAEKTGTGGAEKEGTDGGTEVFCCGGAGVKGGLFEDMESQFIACIWIIPGVLWYRVVCGGYFEALEFVREKFLSRICF